MSAPTFYVWRRIEGKSLRIPRRPHETLRSAVVEAERVQKQSPHSLVQVVMVVAEIGPETIPENEVPY